jgi:hypothetical protein
MGLSFPRLAFNMGEKPAQTIIHQFFPVSVMISYLPGLIETSNPG